MEHKLERSHFAWWTDILDTRLVTKEDFTLKKYLCQIIWFSGVDLCCGHFQQVYCQLQRVLRIAALTRAVNECGLPKAFKKLWLSQTPWAQGTDCSSIRLAASSPQLSPWDPGKAACHTLNLWQGTDSARASPPRWAVLFADSPLSNPALGKASLLCATDFLTDQRRLKASNNPFATKRRLLVNHSTREATGRRWYL